MKKVSVLGLGYIGLPTAIVLAESGYDVVGFDINQQKVDLINKADATIQEPEVYPRLKNALECCLFKATHTLQEADYFVIAVPTPITQDKKADLSYVWSAGELICAVIKKGDVVILESTSSVGTTQQLAQLIQNKTNLLIGQDFYIGYSPERVLPGNIFYELVYNDRVIGGINDASVEKIAEFYTAFVRGEIVKTDCKTAEMVKLIENSSRDVQIAFAHQVASMAQEVNINPYELIKIANKHPRVHILNPRCGVGGHCIAVDPWFLIESFPDQTSLLKAARLVNDNKPHEVIAQVLQESSRITKQTNKRCKIAVLGLTYKPDIDDLRESPALDIAQQLAVHKDLEVVAVDPNINQAMLVNLKLAEFAKAVQWADIIVLLVGHKEFKLYNWQLLDHKKLIDFSGLNIKVERITEPWNTLKKNMVELL